MKIVLTSVGTRGDMEPFLAIGEILEAKGHQVICAFPEQFRGLAEDANLEFASLGKKFIDLLDSDMGQAAMGGSASGSEKFIATVKLTQNQTEPNKELVHRQYEIIEAENPDRVVYNGKAVYPILWGLNHPGKNILISPLPYMHYVSSHSHVAFNSDFGPFINKLTYGLADFGLAMTTKMAAGWLGLTRNFTHKQITTALQTNKAIYTISPSLFPRPDEWGSNLNVLGYHERSKTSNWQPSPALTAFLDKHKNDRILLVTFGSMTNPNPKEKTRTLLEILGRNRIPAIVNTAAGGLVEPDHYDSDLIHFVPQIPYDWIFPKIYGVIHHGGSGTTHLALKYGLVTLVVPHIIDQFVWNKIVARLGAGPEGVKIDKLNAKTLEPKMLELVNDRAFKNKAEQIAAQMEEEDFREAIYQAIVAE